MMYSRQAHRHTVQLNSAMFKAGYFYGKTVLRLGFLFDRLLRRRLKEKLIFDTFQHAADCLLTNLQKINTIYGDLNNDSVIDILDIVLIVNLVLLNEYNDTADLNEDEIINILDIVQMVSLIID